MRKLSFVLVAAAGFTLVAGAAAAPVLAEVRFGINIAPPIYGPPQPYYGPYYGYSPAPYYNPYYGPNPNPGLNIYVNPYPYRQPDRYSRHHYHGYYGR